MDFGIIGEEINTYKLSIPYLDLKLKELSINNSNSILVNNSTPEYIEKSYNIYGTSKQAIENAEKTDDLKNEYFIQIGNPDVFAFTTLHEYNIIIIVLMYLHFFGFIFFQLIKFSSFS